MSGDKGVMAPEAKSEPKLVYGEDGYVLEDVPHLTDYNSSLPVSTFWLFF